ncbi:2-oxoglutarate dehydrogenase E1 component [Pseudenhygromyxa sp. WMMC2535]|uniref:2-oxoglutarate dehydrogenase E1 component n=1 Tax=Pseudenhygromyxa sp. WMMC2535 TaxID=2712867 RepID=UPI001557C87E|nr:2-oxoglutarate dehydrogenase E1 component [Pseudenhygromyxa sp. WMMC2535]NVB39463.1 2-oxoglutarate dehydrogenase E1 component [Pseudenhygromyxa sp. WMMC2535]
MDAEAALSVHNLAFLEALYEAYERDPSSVDPQWIPLLEDRQGEDSSTPARLHSAEPGSTAEQIALQTAVDNLIEAHRLHGHLGADIDPLSRPRRADATELDPKHYGLSEAHYDRLFNSSGLTPGKATLREILDRLRKTYCRHVGVEYWHLYDTTQRAWLQQRMEGCLNEVTPPKDEQLRLLSSLVNVDTVDHFLHSKFLGAKRFSISGAESLIPLLDCLIEGAADHAIGEVIFGMAHRGRLNVLMNILGKSPKEVFSEFSNTDAESYIGAGDVKYHLGYHRIRRTATGKDIYLALAFNPSHLEAITPVIQGRVRAKQDAVSTLGHAASLAVTMHGDAAFCGQGVVAETLNMAALDGYECGGVIRVVINNQIGFTTDPKDARSGVYATDVSHVLGVPVFHVNGDDPEAAAYVARLAVDWRQRFHRDVIIDLICYRQFGHNEGDDPTFTQPRMYEIIKNHASVRKQYEARLIERQTISESECEAMAERFTAEFDQALDEAKTSDPKLAFAPMHGIWERYKGGPERDAGEPETAIPTPELERLGAALTTIPEGFHIHRKLQRLLKQASEMYAGEAELNWAAAELLAYASIVDQGHPVRMSGQDVRRGTFSHRHAVFTDTKNNETWTPLQHIRDGQAPFSIYNSPLSEFSVLGFEFGYSLAAPHGLTIWEAQFGDFANSAQVIIDQFLSSSEDKWNRISGLTLLLPHGYEGQGPEHSSARLERFLQLCAEDNMQVCYLTTPAQLFHCLRRQVLRNWRKPLVMMSPKSLLRFRPSFSPRERIIEGKFHRVIDDHAADPEKVELVLLSAGKVHYDLREARETRAREDVALVRVEQLYPFDSTEEELAAALARFPKAKMVRWVQEEPRNMGSWPFIYPRLLERFGQSHTLEYAGRAASASPATGSPEAHKVELSRVLDAAFA